ncbi:hypothetical protein O9G_004401 [Rozella allomycis CSF55]|uniref:Uncharacterized protein n=1 Tax=Rozella allomycis (strain CSF55) TaxID=988480 RepID=A0A075AQJ4_ROZAC|nr:hypothetical protein O9G_004401 [Rozella allomycis CSF55]|eukprot:EPZ32493.1 hypothetical protein O9G_004401 [Rozella allomycis CSF55]
MTVVSSMPILPFALLSFVVTRPYIQAKNYRFENHKCFKKTINKLVKLMIKRRGFPEINSLGDIIFKNRVMNTNWKESFIKDYETQYREGMVHETVTYIFKDGPNAYFKIISHYKDPRRLNPNIEFLSMTIEFVDGEKDFTEPINVDELNAYLRIIRKLGKKHLTETNEKQEISDVEFKDVEEKK